MATVIDLLRHLGERAAPDGENALAGPVTLPAVTDSPLALPMPPGIVAAWSGLLGRKTVGHHALALSAAQTQHSVALMGHGASPHDDLLLLVFSQFQRPPQPAGLVFVPPDGTGFRQRLIALADALGLRWLDAAQPGGRIGQAELILVTPSDLHRRVLRYHDRAWRWLWPQLRFVALPELHRYTGAEAGHLHWLLRRAERLAQHAPLQILSSLASVADVGATLARLLDRPLQVVAAPDGPGNSTLIALWRCGSERAAPILRLAEQLSARRLAITVFGRNEAETTRLRAMAAERGIAQPQEARVAIVAGVPRATDERQRLLRSGYRLLILLAGDEPHELMFAAQPDLLLNVLPSWPLATHNPYVVAPQMTCAAVERPLEEAEIDRWAVRDLRDRLLKKGVLQLLPSGDLWQVAPDIDEPYAELNPRAIGGEPITILSPDGASITTIPPALQDRCTIPRQVFEPGLQIASRDEDAQTVQLAPDPVERATVVLADMTIRVREELAARTIRFGKRTTDLLKGKVWASQQIVGLRELRADTTQHRLPASASETEWLAAACWIPLAGPVVDPQTIGWAINQALPIVALAPPAALVPAYDAEQQRLYLIEAEPGGVGIIECIYHQFETLIDLALQIVQACVGRPLYKRLAEAELAWINALYGRVALPEPVQAVLPTAQPKPPEPAKALPTTIAPQPKVQVAASAAQPKPRVQVAASAEQPKPQTPALTPAPPAHLPRPPIPATTTNPGRPMNGNRAPVPAYAQTSQEPTRPAASVDSAPVAPKPTPATPAASLVPKDAAPPPAQRRAAAYHTAQAARPAHEPEAPKPAVKEAEAAIPKQPQPAKPAAPIQPANESGPVSRGRINPQYSIEDLLPPLDDEDEVEDEAAPPTAARTEPLVEQRRPPEPGNGRVEPPVNPAQGEDRVRPKPARPPRQRNEPQRPFSHRSPIRQHSAQPQPPRREQPPAPRPDRQRSYPTRSSQNQPPNPPRRADPANSQREQFEPRPPRPAISSQRDADKPTPSRPQSAAPEPEADVNAMIARMRRLRQEREAAQQSVPRTEQPAAAEPVELRFHIGERVQCLPYGIGTVRASRIVAGREQVLIDFPEYGEIEVDPALNLIRQLGSAATADQDNPDD